MATHFSRVRFDDPTPAAHVMLSPNSCLVAYVRNGTNVVIDDVSNAFYGDASSALDADGMPAPRRVGSYVALDDVTTVLWSPDSSCVAVWMAPRATVEIVSASTLAAIARVDGGVGGMRQLLWHPSSRCLYWFGHATAYAVSLADGSTMAFTDGVKVVAPHRYSSWLLQGRSMVVSASPSHTDAAAFSRESSVLQAGSQDGAFIFSVSPCLVRPDADAGETHPTHDDPNATWSDSDATGFAAAVAREVAKIQTAAVDEGIAVTHEAFNVYDAVTHERVATFPVSMSTDGDGPGVPPRRGSITAFRVLSSCVLFFDHANMHVRLLSLDGSRVVGDFHDVAAFDVAPDGGHVYLLDAKRELLITVACVYGRTHRLGDTPLRPSFMRHGTPVLTENAVDDADTLDTDPSQPPVVTAPRSSYSLDADGTDLASFDGYTADALTKRDVTTVFAQAFEGAFGEQMAATRRKQEAAGGPTIDPVIAAANATALVSSSPCGSHIAVVSPKYPTTVFVVHPRSASIVAVLRHGAAVASVAWRPSSQQRDGSGRAPALAIATDSRAGNVYLWTPESAMCVSLPLRPAGDAGNSSGRGRHTASRADRSHSNHGQIAEPSSLVPGSVTRILWGESGHALLLADDLANVFFVALLQA